MAERSSTLRLIIDSSDAVTATQRLDRLGDEANQTARQTDRLDKSMRSVAGGMNTVRSAIAALGLGLLIREAFQLASAWQETENKLRLVTNGFQELQRTQESLIGISQRTFQTYGATADLFSRLARNTEELGLSQKDLLQVTETINKTVALSGTSAQSASAALFQLGQGLAAGALRGEELNSVLENTPELARAIAQGLGVTTGELRKLGAEGKITAEAVIGAIKNQTDQVNSEFSKLTPTIAQIGTVLSEAFNQEFVKSATEEMKEFAEVLARPETLANIQILGKAFGQLFAGIINAITATLEKMNDLASYFEEFNNKYSVIEIKVDLEDPKTIINRLQQIFETELKLQAQIASPSLNLNSTQELANRSAIGAGRIEARELLKAIGIDPSVMDQSAEQLLSALGKMEDGLGRTSEAANDLVDPMELLGGSAKDAAKELKKIEAQIDARNQVVLDAGLQGIRNLVGGAEFGDPIGDLLIEFERLVDLLKLDASQLGGISEGQAQKTLKEIEKLQKELVSKTTEGDGEIVNAIEGIDFEGISVVAEFGERTFDVLTRALDDFRKGTIEGVSRAIGEIGKSVGRGLQNLGDFFGSSALGGIGSAIGAVGQVAGFVSSAVGFFKRLFGKPSDNPTGGGIDLSSGSVSNLFAKNNNAENIQARDALIDATLELTNALKNLTGGNFGAAQLSIQVGNRNGTRIISSQGGDVTTPVGDADAAINEIFRQLVVTLKGGEQALVDYTKAAQAAGRAPEEVIGGLESLKAIFDLTAEPLSDVEQALKNLDDTINPVIADLEGLGLSITQLQQVAADAARQIGKSFIENIQDDIDTFQNATLAQFKRILKSQDQLLKDAATLFERGAITASEFDLVQVRNSLERKAFFDNLSPEELESLGDYLGLIQDSGGSIAVVLTLIQDAFEDFVDNVSETRERLQEQADQLQTAADRIFATRDRIDLRFPSQAGGELLGDLRGQLANLREQALAGDNTAFEKIPELADRFVNLARDLFGSTADFAQERDFALQVLDQTGSLAQSRADKLLTEIEALNTQVEVLNEIRAALESPDPAVDLIQAQLDQNMVTNDLLRDLLQQYIALSQTAQASALTPAQVQAAASAALGVGGGSVGATPVSVDFTDVVVNLNAVRSAITSGNQATIDVLNRLLNETRNQRLLATATG